MVEDQKVVGQVEAVSQKFDGGIKIGEKWYNGTSKTGEYVKKVQKGQQVEITLNEKGKIGFLRTNGGPVSNGNSLPREEYHGPVEESVEDNSIPITQEDIAVILNGEIVKVEALMKVCKEATDRIFGADPNYKESLGQHCNSMFISLDRNLRDKGIRL